MFICKICNHKRYKYKYTKIIYPVCSNCKNKEIMPAFRRNQLRRTDSLGDYVGTLPSGGRVYMPTATVNIDEEIANLKDEIFALKKIMDKKWKRVAELEKKKALQEQEERHKKELQEMKSRVRRETLFLIKNIGNDDSDSETDGLFAKSADEHLSSLCNSN